MVQMGLHWWQTCTIRADQVICSQFTPLCSKRFHVKIIHPVTLEMILILLQHITTLLECCDEPGSRLTILLEYMQRPKAFKKYYDIHWIGLTFIYGKC